MNLLRHNSWAFVISDIEKEYKLLEHLNNKGDEVVFINNNVGEKDGIPIYECLKDVPHNIDIVAFLENNIDIYLLLDEMELLDIDTVYFKKNSINEDVIKKAKGMKLNIEYI